MTYGKFSRLFTLKEEANRDKITAEFSEGLLNIHIPLKEKEAVNAIEIR
jgi:HSP20 family molecular chaperone IbpA